MPSISHPPPPEGSNKIVRFVRRENASNPKETTLKEATRKLILDAFNQTFPPEKPKAPNKQLKSRIAHLPETEIEALLSDLPRRKRNEALLIFLRRAFHRYFELKESILQEYNLEDLLPATQKRLMIFFRRVDILRTLVNKNLDKLI